MKKVFIVGPGGVGKSTSGEILARLLHYGFIDLDTEFCNTIDNIGVFIRQNGYEEYCFQNSKLFYQILGNLNSDSVIVLSSGFLAHEELDDLVEKHKSTLSTEGFTISLLPDSSLKRSTKVIVERQMNRGWKLDREKEKKKFEERYPRYRGVGDAQIYSTDSPEIIAKLMHECVLEN